MSKTNPSDDDPPFRPSLYEQLYTIAEQALRGEKAGHSLQPTLLVNDAYLQLREQRNVRENERSEVLAAGARIIRRLLVDHARARKALKRGGGRTAGDVSLEFVSPDQASHVDILELNDALEALEAQKPRVAKVVELKFFGGLRGREIAAHLGVSRVTAQEDWRYAKQWLSNELGPDRAPDTGPKRIH
jgi:RNA polymerase sigma factor (TIGR02999 family)